MLEVSPGVWLSRAPPPPFAPASTAPAAAAAASPAAAVPAAERVTVNDVGQELQAANSTSTICTSNSNTT